MKDRDSHFLEVQKNVFIHYKLFRQIKQFRKVVPRQGRTASNVDEGPLVIHRMLSIPEGERTTIAAPSSYEQSHSTDAELELDVTDGMEELGYRNAPPIVNSPPAVDDKNPLIIFVLLHGMLSCTSVWDKVATQLRQHGTVVAFDRLGFGLSSKPTKADEVWETISLEALSICSIKGCNRSEPHSEDSEPSLGNSKHSHLQNSVDTNQRWINPYSDQYSAHVVMRLLHHLLDHDESETTNNNRRRVNKKNKPVKITRRTVLLVGHSLGGQVALNCCHFFPQSFAGLILVNAALFSDTAAIPAFAPNLFHQIGGSFFEMLPSLIPPRIAYYDFEYSIDKQQVNNYQKMFLDPNWHEALKLWGDQHFSENSRPDPSATLATISIPVLVISGDHDHVVDNSEGRQIINCLKNGKQPLSMYAEFQQTGHCPMEERPALFVTVLESFLDKFFTSKSTLGKAYFGSTPSLYAEYRNQYRDPFREGCLLMDNSSGAVELITPTTSSIFVASKDRDAVHSSASARGLEFEYHQ